MLFSKDYPAVAGFPDVRVNGIPDHHAKQNGQRQGAEPCAGNRRYTPAP